MSDKGIENYNNVVRLLMFILPLALWCVYEDVQRVDVLTTSILSIIWLPPIVICVADCIYITHVDSLVNHIIHRINQLFNRKAKWVKETTYSLSRLAFWLWLFLLSILTILTSHYHLITYEDFKQNTVILTLLIVILCISCICVFKGFIIIRKHSPENQTDKPSVNDDELSKESLILIETLEYHSQLSEIFNKRNDKLEALNIPKFDSLRYSSNTPFVDYVKELSSIPDAHPELASLEQFALMIADNSDISSLLDSVSESISLLTKDGIEYAYGLKDVLTKTTSSIADYCHHPDGETTQNLLNNIMDAIGKDVNRTFFRLGFSHAKGVSGKIEYLTKHLFTDVGKGSIETFLDHDDLHEINDNFINSLHENIDDVASSISSSTEMDIWDPNFDGSAHFPFITTTIEAIKLASKYSDGDVDMGKALEKSATKIGLTTGGAGLGSIIGTLILPGAGTAIGAMIGGWIGKKGSREINTAELKRLQEEFDEQKNKLDMIVDDTKKNIVKFHKEVSDSIASASIIESNNFEVLKSDPPKTSTDSKNLTHSYWIVLRDYLLDFIKSNELVLSESDKSFIKHRIPTVKQCKDYPMESIKLMLSANDIVNRYSPKSFFCDFRDIHEICLNNIVADIVMAITIQTLWYNQLLNAYKASIYQILQISNNCIKKYIDNVNNEHRKINKEVDKLKEIRNKVEKEKKTL